MALHSLLQMLLYLQYPSSRRKIRLDERVSVWRWKYVCHDLGASLPAPQSFLATKVH